MLKSYNGIRSDCNSEFRRFDSSLELCLGSSAVERPAVNREAEGSNPFRDVKVCNSTERILDF